MSSLQWGCWCQKLYTAVIVTDFTKLPQERLFQFTLHPLHQRGGEHPFPKALPAELVIEFAIEEEWQFPRPLGQGPSVSPFCLLPRAHVCLPHLICPAAVTLLLPPRRLQEASASWVLAREEFWVPPSYHYLWRRAEDLGCMGFTPAPYQLACGPITAATQGVAALLDIGRHGWPGTQGPSLSSS